MSKEELKKYYELYTDCWKFFRKYAELKDENANDLYWESMIDESAVIYGKHKNTDLESIAKAILIATQNELDRLAKS